MKKIFLGMMAVAIMSSFSAQAAKGKKGKKSKKVAKTECCKKVCDKTTTCDKTTCPIVMPGCGGK